MEDVRKKRSSVVGQVVSDNSDKTISVLSFRFIKHARYKKYIKRKTIFKVHDEKNQAKKGDTVKIVLARALSATKRWRLLKVMESTQERV